MGRHIYTQVYHNYQDTQGCGGAFGPHRHGKLAR
jgi:hypothetical protein